MYPNLSFGVFNNSLYFCADHGNSFVIIYNNYIKAE